MFSASKGSITLSSLTDPLKEIEAKKQSAQAHEFNDFFTIYRGFTVHP